MRKLHAFLICSIIGCTTSSLWAMDRDKKEETLEIIRQLEQENQMGGLVRQKTLKLKKVTGIRNTNPFALKVAQNQQALMQAQLEATQEQTAVQQQIARALASIAGSLEKLSFSSASHERNFPRS